METSLEAALLQNREQPELQLYVGTFEVYVLAHLIVAIVPRQFLPPTFFVYKSQNVSKTSAFVTGKCRLKVKSAGGT